MTLAALRTDLLAPRYLIKVEGTKLEADLTNYVEEVEFEEEENAASKITLRVANPNFEFLDTKVFAEGNKIDLWMGYVGKPLHFMNRGIIIRPNPDFPRSGIPRMTIVAHDLSRKLMQSAEEDGKEDKGKVYKKKRDSEIAEELFKEIEAAPFTFQTKGLQTRVRQRGTSKWQFLQNLALLHNFVVFVKYDPQRRINVGYFGPPDVEDQPNKYTFVYGTGEPDATCLEFHPDLSLASQQTKIVVVYTDAKKRKTYSLELEVTGKKAEITKFTGVSGTSKLKREIKAGTSVQLTVFGQRQELIPGKRFSSAKEAMRWAAAWWQRREEEFAFARGVVVGVPDLRRGHVHAFKGLGVRLSGDWQMIATSHRQGSGGYETEFSARKVVLQSVVGAPDSTAKVKKSEGEQ